MESEITHSCYSPLSPKKTFSLRGTFPRRKAGKWADQVLKKRGPERTVAMYPILYLGIEGVLFRASVCRHPLARRGREIPRSDPLPLLGLVSHIVQHQTNLRVVLNSWWVVDYGFQRLISCLPSPIAQRTVGATIPGNRLHRKVAYQERADLLRADVKKREPTELTILDASRAAIPIEYLNRSVWVGGDHTAHVNECASRLLHLLNYTGPIDNESKIPKTRSLGSTTGSPDGEANTITMVSV
jgi:hypothetical protein